ncbi:thiamine pyrophosphate-dependent enzyme [Clavibacter sp. CFBP 8614]|uniref:thiamine pyrophosphate-dependent enzyme n=1 Tax=unclassified Clavibacter TaxID=2626594 RepID=UPI004041F46B
MRYEDAFRALLDAHADAAVVATCGHISRDLFGFHDRGGNLYLVGSMGMAGPVALGVSIQLPSTTVIAIDGDGSAAMNLSGAASVAGSGNRILHVVLDNGQHGSTGGQRVSPSGDLAAVARGLGYRTVLDITTEDELAGIAGIARFPAFARIRVAPRSGPIGPRVSLAPRELRDRFAAHLRSDGHEMRGEGR